MSRLQFVHYNGVVKNFSREDATNYIKKLTNRELATNLGESLLGEPLVVTYLDNNNNVQIMLAIGTSGETEDNILAPYHIIDLARIDEKIETITIGAGLNEDGTYKQHNVSPGDLAHYISTATSLDNADVILDKELYRVEVNLGAEEARAQAAEEAEAQERFSADTQLQENINSEITRATGAEGELNDKIEALSAKTETIETALNNEITRATDAENSISGNVNTLSASVITFSAMTDLITDNLQDEIDVIEEGAGLQSDGTYKAHDSLSDPSYYISTATSLDKADVILDRELRRVEDRVDVISSSTVSALTELSGSVVTFSGAVATELDNTQAGAGLQADGTYKQHNTSPDDLAHYIAPATSLDKADVILDDKLYELSGVVETLSANTDSKLNAEITRANAAELQLLSAITNETTERQNADNILQENITGEQTRATSIENLISGNVITLSGSVETLDNKVNALSAGTENKINELSGATEEAISKLTLKSTDGTVKITTAITGTDISINVDGVTIAKNNDGTISTELTIQKLSTPSSENVREEYALVDNNGIYHGNTIKIYKDSSLQSVELVTIAGKEYLRFTYITADGSLNVVDIDVSSFLSETEFKDGFRVSGGNVYVLVDPASENYLTVSSNGVKISGVDNAIATAVNAETTRATTAENNLQTAINAETTRATAAENSISGTVDTLSGSVVNEVNRLDGKIEAETTRATAAEDAINTRITNLSSSTVSEITRPDGKIDSEVIARQSGDSILQQAIDNEAATRLANDNTLQSNLNTEASTRQNADTQLQGNINAEQVRATGAETALQTALNNEVTRATNAESAETVSRQNADTQLQNAITAEATSRANAIETVTDAFTEADNNIITAYTAAISDEITNRTDADDRLERMITSSVSAETVARQAADNAINNRIDGLSASVETHIERATASATTLNNAITAETSARQTAVNDERTRAMAAESALQDAIDNIDTTTVSGTSAITVNTVNDVATVSLLINGGEKVLSQDIYGLKSTITIELSADTSNNEYIVLKGKNNEVISSVNVNKFVKDGMLDNVTFDSSTNTLKFIFNTDSGKQQIDVPLGSLVDIYTVSANSTGYLAIEDYKIGAKVNVDGGLASYGALNNEITRATTAENSISGSVNTLSGSVINLSASTVNIGNNVTQVSGAVITTNNLLNNETTRATYAESSISGNVNTLSGSVVNNTNEINLLKQRVQTLEQTVSGLQTTVANLQTTIDNLISGIESAITTSLYNNLVNIVEGTPNEIAVTGDATNQKLNISFADPYVIGEHTSDNENDY